MLSGDLGVDTSAPSPHCPVVLDGAAQIYLKDIFPGVVAVLGGGREEMESNSFYQNFNMFQDAARSNHAVSSRQDIYRL